MLFANTILAGGACVNPVSILGEIRENSGVFPWNHRDLPRWNSCWLLIYIYFWGFGFSGKFCSRTAGEVLVNTTKTLQAADKKLLIIMSDQTWAWFLYSREAASTSFFLFFSLTNIIKQQMLAGNLHAGSQPGIEKICSWQSLMIATWWLSHHNPHAAIS